MKGGLVPSSTKTRPRPRATIRTMRKLSETKTKRRSTLKTQKGRRSPNDPLPLIPRSSSKKTLGAPSCEHEFKIVVRDASKDSSEDHKYTIIISEDNKKGGCKYRVKENEDNELTITGLNKKETKERNCAEGNDDLNQFINELTEKSKQSFKNKEELEEFLDGLIKSCPLNIIYAEPQDALSEPPRRSSTRSTDSGYLSISPEEEQYVRASNVRRNKIPPPVPSKHFTQVRKSVASTSAKKSTPRLTPTQDVIPKDAKIKGPVEELKNTFIRQLKQTVDGFYELFYNDIDINIQNYEKEIKKEKYIDEKERVVKYVSVSSLFNKLKTFHKELDELNNNLNMHYDAIQDGIKQITTFTELNENLDYIVSYYLTPQTIVFLSKISYILMLLVKEYKYMKLNPMSGSLASNFSQYLARILLPVKELVKNLMKADIVNEELNKNLEKIMNLADMANNSIKLFEDVIKTDIESLKTYLDIQTCKLTRETLLEGDNLKLDENMKIIIDCFKDSNLSLTAEKEMCNNLKKDAGKVGAIRGAVNNKIKTRKQIYNKVCKRTNKVRKGDIVKVTAKRGEIMMGQAGEIPTKLKNPFLKELEGRIEKRRNESNI